MPATLTAAENYLDDVLIPDFEDSFNYCWEEELKGGATSSSEEEEELEEEDDDDDETGSRASISYVVETDTAHERMRRMSLVTNPSIRENSEQRNRIYDTFDRRGDGNHEGDNGVVDRRRRELRQYKAKYNDEEDDDGTSSVDSDDMWRMKEGDDILSPIPPIGSVSSRGSSYGFCSRSVSLSSRGSSLGSISTSSSTDSSLRHQRRAMDKRREEHRGRATGSQRGRRSNLHRSQENTTTNNNKRWGPRNGNSNASSAADQTFLSPPRRRKSEDTEISEYSKSLSSLDLDELSVLSPLTTSQTHSRSWSSTLIHADSSVYGDSEIDESCRISVGNQKEDNDDESIQLALSPPPGPPKLTTALCSPCAVNRFSDVFSQSPMKPNRKGVISQDSIVTLDSSPRKPIRSSFRSIASTNTSVRENSSSDPTLSTSSRDGVDQHQGSQRQVTATKKKKQENQMQNKKMQSKSFCSSRPAASPRDQKSTSPTKSVSLSRLAVKKTIQRSFSDPMNSGHNNASRHTLGRVHKAGEPRRKLKKKKSITKSGRKKRSSTSSSEDDLSGDQSTSQISTKIKSKLPSKKADQLQRSRRSLLERTKSDPMMNQSKSKEKKKRSSSSSSSSRRRRRSRSKSSNRMAASTSNPDYRPTDDGDQKKEKHRRGRKTSPIPPEDVAGGDSKLARKKLLQRSMSDPMIGGRRNAISREASSSSIGNKKHRKAKRSNIR